MELGKILTNRLQEKREPLSDERETELSAIIQGDASETQKDDAVQELVESNLGLGIKIACDFHRRKYLSDGIDLSDFISEAFVGIMEAAKRYNAGKARFSWYAAYWIKMKIFRFSENTMKNIRKPVSISQKIRKLKKLKENDESRESIVKELNLSNDHELTILELTEKLHFEDSLDKEIGNEDGGSYSLYDMLECPIPDPSQACCIEDKKKEILNLVTKLPQREKYIIQHRFCDNVLTLQEIGEHLRLTKERVRQLEQSALHKLKRLLAEE